MTLLNINKFNLIKHHIDEELIVESDERKMPRDALEDDVEPRVVRQLDNLLLLLMLLLLLLRLVLLRSLLLLK